MKRFLPLVLAVAPACSSTSAGVTDADVAAGLPWPELTDETLDAWVEHVRPRGEELATDSIGWIPEFAEGVRESARRERPLLFWAMNGHPLGCT